MDQGSKDVSSRFAEMRMREVHRVSLRGVLKYSCEERKALYEVKGHTTRRTYST
jgi:hypothetical protein